MGLLSRCRNRLKSLVANRHTASENVLESKEKQ